MIITIIITILPQITYRHIWATPTDITITFPYIYALFEGSQEVERIRLVLTSAIH